MKIFVRKTPTSNFELLEIPDHFFGKGGQAHVYKILTKGFEEYCVKIFTSSQNARDTYERIIYMIQNPPKNIMSNSGFRICWPTALAYDVHKNFIGYVMPLAFPGSRDLTILQSYNAKPISQQGKFKKYPDWFDKYELNTNTGLKNRMKMLCNWAIAIYSLHETHKYVIIDLKPENVMATSSGKISIVDTDSFQISENGRILFPGPMCTPGYFPPEGRDIRNKHLPFTIACDCFSSAICFYRILVGVHPYGGTIKKPPYDRVETDDESIEEGLFAYGDKKQYLQFPAFNIHKYFENLPPEIQALFKRAFGNNPNNRPALDEWGKTLHQVIVADSAQVRSVVKPPQTNPFSIQILQVDFCDADYNGNIIRNYGSRLYTDVTYLSPRLTYKVHKVSLYKEIAYSIYSPSGRLQTGVSSKPGITAMASIDCSANTVLTCAIPGWGSNDKTIYAEPGTWRVEFYEGNKCLYKTSVEICALTTKQTYYTPPTAKTSLQHQKKYSSTKRRKSTKWFAWFLILVTTLGGIYQFWYKDYKRDKDAPRYYAFTNLNLRSSQVADVDHNLLEMLTYGTELITYSSNGEWAEVKANGKTGFVSSDLILSAEDFHLLNSIWGNTDAKDCVKTAKCRLALLDYYKRTGLQGGVEWQLYTKKEDEKPNAVWYGKAFDTYSKFTDFAFILKNNQTGERKFALYSFDDETEEPIFRLDMGAPSDTYIRNVAGYPATSGMRISVSYTNGMRKTVFVSGKQKAVEPPLPPPPPANSEENKVSTKQSSGIDLFLLGENAYKKKDYATAQKYYKEAADKGVTEAYAQLGWMAYNGWGSPVDGTIAISYLKDAVELGNANACYYLGYLYEHGVYTSQLFKSIEQAIHYYKLGSDRGQEDAHKAYLRLSNNNRQTTASSATNEKMSSSVPSSGLVLSQDLAGKAYRLSNPFRQKGGAYTIAFWTDDFSSRTIVSAIHPDGVKGWDFPKVTFQSNGIFLLGTEDRSSISYAVFPYDMARLHGKHFICVVCNPSVYQQEKKLYVDGKHVTTLPNPQLQFAQSACPTLQTGSQIYQLYLYIRALSDKEVMSLYQASR